VNRSLRVDAKAYLDKLLRERRFTNNFSSVWDTLLSGKKTRRSYRKPTQVTGYNTTKVLGIIVLKELGKMTPYLWDKEDRRPWSQVCSGLKTFQTAFCGSGADKSGEATVY